MFEEPAIVQWCEAHTDQYVFSKYIAELTNSFSNLIFVVMAAASMASYTPAVFWKCDATLILVGLGSFYFHATDTFFGEMLDEFA